jgi:hypothetical protein
MSFIKSVLVISNCEGLPPLPNLVVTPAAAGEAHDRTAGVVAGLATPGVVA